MDVTFSVFTVNVTVVLPVGIVTVEGTTASEDEEAIEIVEPPVGAADSIVTVAVTEPPPSTVPVFNAIDLRTGGVTVSVAET